jgi:GDP-4-dehydro-6-deoxy-D-mannose reductase
MRILVTGSSGFVGRWLARELRDAGHEVVCAGGRDDLDVTDARAVRSGVAQARPDSIAHLAAMTFGPDARRDPERAFAVNALGTRHVLEAAVAHDPSTRVLLVSSAEVYGHPDPARLPIDENAPLAAVSPYGRSKIAAERSATELATAHDLPLTIVRPFNHSGPGQRLDFVVPSIAARIVEASRRGDPEIVAGNLDVRRDFGDVRDVVRAYRLLLEASLPAAGATNPWIVNVATGRSVAIRTIVDTLAGLAGHEVVVRTDPALVRSDDPPEIRGDATRLRAATGWAPAIPLEQTLVDVLIDVRARLDRTAVTG